MKLRAAVNGLDRPTARRWVRLELLRSSLYGLTHPGNIIIASVSVRSPRINAGHAGPPMRGAPGVLPRARGVAYFVKCANIVGAVDSRDLEPS